MSLLLAGVNHRSSPVQVRERLAVLGAKAASEALVAEGWRESVVLATCNRFEVYAAGEGDPERFGRFLDRFAGTEVAPFAYQRRTEQAARHLFEVAAGLDSLVLGESEILGQVKQAYEAARGARTTGKLTNVLFQRALFVGKSVRTRTAIGVGQVSVASAAVELARKIFGSLEDSSVLVLGAGEMAEKTARHLLASKAARLWLSNRTEERARALAASLSEPGRPPVDVVSWENFPEELSRVDIVVASTGALKPILTRAHVERALAARRGRSLFLIDIAMPRDVAEDAGELDGVYLYTMQDLEAIVRENAARRQSELEAARAIVGREADEFGAWLASVLQGKPFDPRRAA